MVTDEDVSPHLLPLIEGATDHCLTAPVIASKVTQEPADRERNVHLLLSLMHKILSVFVHPLIHSHGWIGGKFFNNGFHEKLIADVGGAENITDETMPEVHIRGDVMTPYKCIGGVIYTMQYAGYQRIGFISEPAPGSATVPRL